MLQKDKERRWPFYPLAEGVIILSVSLLCLKATYFNFIDFEFGIPYIFDFVVFGVCIVVVLISGLFDGFLILAVDNKLLFMRTFSRVIAFIYVIYMLGFYLKTTTYTVLILELVILLFLSWLVWTTSFTRLIQILHKTMIHNQDHDSDLLDDMEHDNHEDPFDIDEHHN